MANFSKNVRSYFREIDTPLFIAVVAVSLLGALNIWGVTGGGSLLFKKQIIFIVVGLFMMVVLSFFNYRYFKSYSLSVLLFYFVCIFLLLLTF